MTPEERSKWPCVIEWQDGRPEKQGWYLVRLVRSRPIVQAAWFESKYGWRRLDGDSAFSEEPCAWAEMPTKTLEQAIEERARTTYIGD